MAEPRGSTSTRRGSPLGRGGRVFRYRSVARQQVSAQLRRVSDPARVVRRVEAQELLVEHGQGPPVGLGPGTKKHMFNGFRLLA